MTAPILFALPGNEALAPCLAEGLGSELGEIEVRHFPDGESYVRFGNEVEGRPIVLLATLDRPNDKVLALIFAAMAAREQGARSIGLIAPYLAYMRQDRRFRPGESVTSRHFAKLVSGAFDWLVTVDPHLHRYKALSEIYSIPATTVASAPLLAEWIKHNVTDAVLIGPDEESRQWVAEVARDAGGAPFTVLNKIRRGDRDVDVSLPNKKILEGRTPVLVDDIVSTAGTMAEAVRHVSRPWRGSAHLRRRPWRIRGLRAGIVETGRRRPHCHHQHHRRSDQCDRCERAFGSGRKGHAPGITPAAHCCAGNHRKSRIY